MAPVDRYYHTADWLKRRAAVLARDRHQCKLRLPGCAGRANIVDHRIERKQGGSDEMSNLIACCAPCHNRRHPEKGFQKAP